MLKLATKKVARTSAIGLDLGDSAMRAAQVIQRRGLTEVVGVVQADRQYGNDQSERLVVESPWLKRSLSSAGFRGNKIVLGLSSPEAEFHALDMKKKLGDKMHEAIKDETLRMTNHAAGQMETNYWMLPDTPAPVPNVMSVAAPTLFIEQAMDTCDQAGFSCHCVDVAPTALGRFASKLKPWPTSSVWGILDIGQRQARLMIYVDQVPVLVRRVGAGVQAWISVIASALSVSESTARIQLYDHGVVLSNRGNAQAGELNGSELSGILGGYLRRDLHDLTSEISRSYEYILSSFPKREADDLVLVGRGACVRGVSEYFAQGLGISVRSASAYLGTPDCRLQFDSGKSLPLEMFGLAIGLAIEDE